jgi:hypothetical protein
MRCTDVFFIMRIEWESLHPYLGFLIGMLLIVFLIYKDRKFPHELTGKREQVGEPEEDG